MQGRRASRRRQRKADPAPPAAAITSEVEHRPELFRVLRVLVDRPDSPARSLVLGSASPDLLRQSSESLAGRIAYYELVKNELDG